MSDLKKYHGVIPAFYACYDEEGNISPERVRGLTRHLIGKGNTIISYCSGCILCIIQNGKRCCSL